MKKQMLLFCIALIILSLTTYSFMNGNDLEIKPIEKTLSKDDVSSVFTVEKKVKNRVFSDFIYDVGPRFGAIKKEDLDKIKSIDDFLDKEQVTRIISYKSVSVIIIENDEETDRREIGYTNILTDAQIKLLRSSEYSTNLKIRAEFQQTNKETGVLEDSYSTPHLTIVPEKQATYEDGKDALIEYLKLHIKDHTTNIKENDLKPAKLVFTVNKKGGLENIKLDRSSNFPTIDKKMIELLTNAPGIWIPAENSKGEKRDQELVISFGLMGC